jgi:hypothetical protein
MCARITPKRLGSTGPSAYYAGPGIANRSRRTESYARSIVGSPNSKIGCWLLMYPRDYTS